MSEVGLLSLFAISGIAVLITFVALGGLYLLFSYGLYKMATRQGIEYSWLAFIPIAQYYTMGKVIKNVTLFGYLIPHLEWVLILTPIIYGILSAIPYVNILAGIAYAIFYIKVTYSLFQKYSDSAMMLTILGIILPFLYPIFVFAIRNNNPIQR